MSELGWPWRDEEGPTIYLDSGQSVLFGEAAQRHRDLVEREDLTNHHILWDVGGRTYHALKMINKTGETSWAYEWVLILPDGSKVGGLGTLEAIEAEVGARECH